MTAALRTTGIWLAVAGLVLAVPSVAHADAGIPMMPLPYPTFLWFLPAVIILEVFYVLMTLRVPWGRAILALTAVNAATTGLGFPLTWGIYNLLSLFANFPTAASGAFSDMQYVPGWMCMRLFPDWVGTPEELGITLAIFVTLLVPSYLISRLLKTWVIEWYDLLACGGDSRAVVLGANRASYALLAVAGCAMLIKGFRGI